METIIDIYELSGNDNNRAYILKYSQVRAWILPASNEAVAMYDNLPQGQMYQYRILDEDVENINEQAKLVISESQMSGFDNGDSFITVTSPKKAILGGKRYLSGMCYIS